MEGKLIEDLKPIYDESVDLKNKEKLQETFKKKDRVKGKLQKLEAEKAAMELLYKDHEILSKYFDILKQLKELALDDKQLDNELYEAMEASGEELLEGKYCNVTIKHPYSRTQMDTKQFLQDFSPRTNMYKKYISIIEVKGNIIVKDKK